MRRNFLDFLRKGISLLQKTEMKFEFTHERITFIVKGRIMVQQNSRRIKEELKVVYKQNLLSIQLVHCQTISKIAESIY